MKKIERLTKEQESRLVEFGEEWLGYGLCCDPADFETGDAVIRGFYRRLNKPDPIILHFSSPAMCELAVNFVFAMLAEKRPEQLGSQLESQLESQLIELKPYFRNNYWGAQHWCAWEAFYLFGHELGVRYEPDNIALLLEWARQSKNIGWWSPWDGICFVSDRPRKVKFDNERRLHCEDGKAVEYSDGWGVSSWHGTRIPDEWLTNKKSLTAKVALTEKNIEQRRVAIEVLGWNKILLELKAKVIDEHPDPSCGSLVEVKLPDLENPARFIRAMCGTRREFAIGVPAEIQSVIAAQAWLTGLTEKQFEFPSIRT